MVALLAQTFVRVLIGPYLGLVSRHHCLRHGVHADVPDPHGKDMEQELENVRLHASSNAKAR